MDFSKNQEILAEKKSFLKILGITQAKPEISLNLFEII